MPRSNRPRKSKKNSAENAAPTRAVLYGVRTRVVKRSVAYIVQTHSGAAEDENKSWICPSCNLSIGRGVSHVVAWDEERGSETRRHFHTVCWQKWQGQLL